MPKPFLTAEWRNLLMANFSIDAALLKPFLPFRTELDTFNGVHYVSLVGFLFSNTKVLGVSIPYHRTFEEVNLRFYVRYKEENRWKRGVVFMKELVPKRAITLVANNLYGEKYATCPMRHSWQISDAGFEVSYQWNIEDNWNYLSAIAEKTPSPLTEGSEEEFITEHYWGYTFMKHNCTGTYQVEHPRWDVYKVLQYNVHCNAGAVYGPQFAEVLAQNPKSVFLAGGSAVSVLKGTKIFAS